MLSEDHIVSNIRVQAADMTPPTSPDAASANGVGGASPRELDDSDGM